MYSLSVDMKKSDSIRQLRLNLKDGNVRVGHVQPLNHRICSLFQLCCLSCLFRRLISAAGLLSRSNSNVSRSAGVFQPLACSAAQSPNFPGRSSRWHIPAVNLIRFHDSVACFNLSILLRDCPGCDAARSGVGGQSFQGNGGADRTTGQRSNAPVAQRDQHHWQFHVRA